MSERALYIDTLLNMLDFKNILCSVCFVFNTYSPLEDVNVDYGSLLFGVPLLIIYPLFILLKKRINIDNIVFYHS